jgi:hypothetical protein
MTSQSVISQTRDPGESAVSWAPLAVILCGTFVYILDFFVVNVALPSIQRSLAASPAAIEWVVAGYALTSASLLVTGGRLGDHYGRRKMFRIGVAAFTVTSALCAVAPGAGFLIAARLAQRRHLLRPARPRLPHRLRVEPGADGAAAGRGGGAHPRHPAHGRRHWRR